MLPENGEIHYKYYEVQIQLSSRQLHITKLTIEKPGQGVKYVQS